jgi:hypothetical protein
LTDIARQETWVELEEDINKRSGLDANVFNVEGYRISEWMKQQSNVCPMGCRPLPLPKQNPSANISPGRLKRLSQNDQRIKQHVISVQQ